MKFIVVLILSVHFIPVCLAQTCHEFYLSQSVKEDLVIADLVSLYQSIRQMEAGPEKVASLKEFKNKRLDVWPFLGVGSKLKLFEQLDLEPDVSKKMEHERQRETEDNLFRKYTRVKLFKNPLPLLSPNSDYLVEFQSDGNFTVTHLLSGHVTKKKIDFQPAKHNQSVKKSEFGGARFSNDGKHLFIIGGRYAEIRILKFPSLEVLVSKDSENQVSIGTIDERYIASSLHSRWVLFRNPSGDDFVYDLLNQEQIPLRGASPDKLSTHGFFNPKTNSLNILYIDEVGMQSMETLSLGNRKVWGRSSAFPSSMLSQIQDGGERYLIRYQNSKLNINIKKFEVHDLVTSESLETKIPLLKSVRLSSVEFLERENEFIIIEIESETSGQFTYKLNKVLVGPYSVESFTGITTTSPIVKVIGYSPNQVSLLVKTQAGDILEIH